MTDYMETHLQEFASSPPAEFVAAARYFEPMDCLLYLKEDCSYRAIRLSPAVTILLHPQEDRAVGVKVKGVRFLAESLRAVLASEGINFSDRQVIHLLAILEMAFAAGWGDAVIAEADAERHRQYAQRARELVAEATVPIAELPVSEYRQAA